MGVHLSKPLTQPTLGYHALLELRGPIHRLEVDDGRMSQTQNKGGKERETKKRPVCNRPELGADVVLLEDVLCSAALKV